nr:hypothetical protein [Murinocardiopsis flavida]
MVANRSTTPRRSSSDSAPPDRDRDRRVPALDDRFGGRDAAHGPGHRAELLRVGDRQFDPVAGQSGDQLGRAARRDQAAGVEQADFVAQLLGLVQLLGGQQHGRPGRDTFGDHPPDPPPADRVEADRRLVGEDHGRRTDEARGEVEPPPHAAGVGAHPPVGGLRQVHQVEHLGGAVGGGRPAVAPEPRDQPQVLPSGQGPFDGGGLADTADQPPHRARRTPHVVTEYAGRARGRPFERGQDADGGRLPRAVAPQQAGQCPGRHPQVDAVQRGRVAVPHDHVIQFHGGRAHGRPPSP